MFWPRQPSQNAAESAPGALSQLLVFIRDSTKINASIRTLFRTRGLHSVDIVNR
jgi:hypothetical protein